MSAIVGALLGERRDLGREVVDEGRRDQVGLPQPLEDRRGDLAGAGRGRRPRCAAPRATAAARVPIAQVVGAHRAAEPGGRGLGGGVPQRQTRRNGAASEMACSPNGHSVPPVTWRATAASSSSVKRHQRLVVDVGPVELEHRELGVVLGRDPLVPEVTVDLEHPFDAADDQPLEVQLGRDPQVELEVEGVVMGDEGPGQRAAGDRLHHRRLDFEEAACRQELAHRRDGPAARLEDAADFGIHRQVEIALAVARLDVAQAVPLLGQRQVALGQERERRGPHRQLVGLGAEEVAGDADVVADVEQPRRGEVARASARPGAGRPGAATGRRTARGSWPCRSCGCRRSARRPPSSTRGASSSAAGVASWRLDQRRHRVRGVEAVRMDVDAEGVERRQVGPPLVGLLRFVGHEVVGSAYSMIRPSARS